MGELFKFGVALGTIFSGFTLAPLEAQDVEPRRWGHLPMGSHFVGGAYAYTGGDIAFDPVLLIDDAELDLHTVAMKYVYSFEWFERSARIDLLMGYQEGRWKGLLNGVPASTDRSGLSDTVVRFSMNLIGAPPLDGEGFAEYRANLSGPETIAGVALSVHLPTGNYLEDRLLNLGANRFTFRPHFGVVHNRGKLSLEVTGSAWLYTENDEFYGGNKLEQDPLYSVQGHMVYTFRPGLWVGGGIAYGAGAESTLNGVKKGDDRSNLAWGVSFGYPINPRLGVKVGYIGMRTQEEVGADLDTLTAAFSFMW